MPASVPGFRPGLFHPPASPARLALAGLALLTLVRLAVAAIVPLAPDETYYWVWSQHLQGGYLDHPPMVALWIRLGTDLLGATPLGVRLLGPLSGAAGSVLLWHAAEALLPGRRAGWIATVLLNATLLFGVGSVVMTPDTPLLFFWVCCLWALARFVRDPNGWWLALAGVAAGAAFDSKYTAAFLALGVALWLIWVPSLRRLWLNPAPYWGMLWGMQAVLPVVNWNRTHGWVSFLKQGGRLDHWHPANAPRLLGELIGAQLGLATPLVFAFCVAGVVLATREAWRRRDPACSLLAAMTLPAVLVFLQHTLAGRVQGNWPAVLYPAAAIAAAGLEAPVWRRLFAPAAVLGLAITALVYVQAATAILPLPVRRDPTALQLRGWGGLASRVAAVARQTGAAFVAADDYAPASELAWHLPAGTELVGVEPRWAYFDLPRPALAGRAGVLVRQANAGPPPTASWTGATLLGTVWRRSGGGRSGGQRIAAFRLFRVTVRPGPAAAVLPRR